MEAIQAFDENKLNAFIGQVLGDLGGAYSAALVKIGDWLGLYRELQSGGPATSSELAERTGYSERYLREWLAHHAASNYLDYDPSSKRFRLPPGTSHVLRRFNQYLRAHGTGATDRLRAWCPGRRA